jgi:glycosyltransferase involved in cell wall biosynthesis
MEHRHPHGVARLFRQLESTAAEEGGLRAAITALADLYESLPERPVDVFLTVVLRTQGRRLDTLEEMLLCLAAQEDKDFELLVTVHSEDERVWGRVRSLTQLFEPMLDTSPRLLEVVGGGRTRPLNVAISEARGHYIAFIDDDDLVTSDWVSAFHEAADRNPGTLIRSITATQSATAHRTTDERIDYTAIGGPEFPFPPAYDAVAHFGENQTPFCSFAAPVAVLRRWGIRFRENLAVLEDWAFLLHVTQFVDVTDTHAITAVYRVWGATEGASMLEQNQWDTARRRIVEELDARTLLLPAGAASRLYDVWRSRDAATALALAEMYSSRSWRVTGPLRWGNRQATVGKRRIRSIGLRVAKAAWRPKWRARHGRNEIHAESPSRDGVSP